jgi:hypothetical protein
VTASVCSCRCKSVIYPLLQKLASAWLGQPGTARVSQASDRGDWPHFAARALYPTALVSSHHRPCRSSGGQSQASHRGGLGSSLGYVIWDLGWKLWFYPTLYFPLTGILLNAPHYYPLSSGAGTIGHSVASVKLQSVPPQLKK